MLSDAGESSDFLADATNIHQKKLCSVWEALRSFPLLHGQSFYSFSSNDFKFDYWLIRRDKKNSFFVKKFYGLWNSELVCAHCGHE